MFTRMKYGVVTLVLLLMLALSACGKQEKEMAGLRSFSAQDPAWFIRAKVENAVKAKTRGEIITMWGEPDSMTSGVFGDIYTLENGWTVLLLYNGQYGTEDAYVGSVRIGNTDASVGLVTHYSYQDTDIKEDPFSSPGVTLDGQTGQASLGLPLKSSYMLNGEYSMTGNIVTIFTIDRKHQFTFQYNGKNLIFDQENSSDFDWYAKIPDGAVFESETALDGEE